MNKLQNLSKFLGVVIGLLLGQAVYAQKVVDSRNPVQPPTPVAYVTGSTALSRIDTKVTQYLGQWKNNVAGAQLKHQYYSFLRVYVSEGATGLEAIKAALVKMQSQIPSKDWAGEITAEASVLLQQ